jgi:hypothetical protein
MLASKFSIVPIQLPRVARIGSFFFWNGKLFLPIGRFFFRPLSFGSPSFRKWGSGRTSFRKCSMHKPDTLSWLFRKSFLPRAFRCARLDKLARGARNFRRGYWNRDTFRGREARFSSWYEFMWLRWNPDTPNFRNPCWAPTRRRLCTMWRLKCIWWKRSDLHRLLMWLSWRLLSVPPCFPGACFRMPDLCCCQVITCHEWLLMLSSNHVQASAAQPDAAHCASSGQPTRSAAFRPFEQLRSVALFVF